MSSEKKWVGFADLYAVQEQKKKRVNAKPTRVPSVSPDADGDAERGKSGGYTPRVVATNVATETPLVATNVATTKTGGYTKYEKGGYTKTRKGDRHKYDDREQFNIRLSKDKARSINELCAKSGITKVEFWDLVATRILELVATDVATLGQTFPGLVATNVAHDDSMMIFNTCDDIINAHARYAAKDWTPSDDRVAAVYNEADFRIVEIAMIQVVEKKLRGTTSKQPIKSFNYFIPEIETLLDQQKNGELPPSLDEYHRYVLTTWEKRIRPLRDEKWKPKK